MEGSGDFEKVEAGRLVKGSLVMIGGKPRKVVHVSKAKPGKHGSAKAIITAVGLLDDKKVERSYGTSDLLDAPIVKRIEYALLGFEDDFLILQSESGHTREDLKLSEQASMKEVNDLIKKNYDEDVPSIVTIMSVCGQEIPVAVKEDTLDI